MNTKKFIVEGKLGLGQNLLFVETEKDIKTGYPLGTFIHELVENNFEEGDEIVFIIEKRMK